MYCFDGCYFCWGALTLKEKRGKVSVGLAMLGLE